MEKTSAQNSAALNLSSKQLKVELDNYLAGQSESIHTFHRIMKVMESISLAIMIVTFITAIVASFMWKTIPVSAIPTAWFLLPVGMAVLMLLIAVHALVLHAYPPSRLFTIYQSGSPMRQLGRPQQFVTGKAANIQALGLFVVALVVGGFFAVFAWSSWTLNWTILTPMIKISATALGILIAVGIVGGMALKTYQKLSKPQ